MEKGNQSPKLSIFASKLFHLVLRGCSGMLVKKNLKFKIKKKKKNFSSVCSGAVFKKMRTKYVFRVQFTSCTYQTRSNVRFASDWLPLVAASN